MTSSVSLLQHGLRLLAADHGPSDADLLARFARDRDEAAFETLVQRHGPMVLGVCRRILGDAQDAEDAFQATFLVLTRKAGQLARPEALSGWLHGVALKVALNACTRRRPLPLSNLALVPARPDADPLARLTARELHTLLDEEVHRLPEVARLPVILCCLQGLSHEEAARQLGWTPGSVKGRLERGRKQLQAQLTKRGVTLSSMLAPGFLHGGAEAAAAWSKGRMLLAAVLAALLTLGGGTLAYQALSQTPAAGDKPVIAQAENKPAPRFDALGDALPDHALLRLGTTRLRHGGRVAALAFSPDGKTVATSSDGYYDPVIYFWDVATGKELRRIYCPEPLRRFTSVVFSPDGKTLVSGESGNFTGNAGEPRYANVRVWDVATGKQIRACEGHSESITCVAISPDGKTLGSCANDQSVRLWNAATGKELHRCARHPYAIYCVAFSPDGKTLASGAYDKVVRLWDVATGNQVKEIQAHVRGAMKLSFSPDGKSLAVGGDDNLIRLLDVSSGKLLREFAGHEKPIWGGVVFQPDGKGLVSASRDGSVRVWDVATGKEVRRMRADSDDLFNLALSPDGKTIAAGGQSGTAHLWDMETGKALHAYPGHTGSIQGLRYSPNGRTIASGGTDGTVRLWDVRTGKERKLSSTQGVWIKSVVFSPDGKMLLADDDAGDAFSLWDVAAGTVVRRFAGHKGGTATVAFAPDGKTVASGGMDKVIRLWDAATGKELGSLADHDEPIGEVVFSPNGKMLASCENGSSMERMIYLWDLGKRVVVHRVGPARGEISFSPDGFTVMARSRNETIGMWDTATGKETRTLSVPKRADDLAHVTALHSPTFSPDGKYVALGWHRTLRVLEVLTGQEVCSFSGGYHSAFAPDGRSIAAVDNTSIVVWDLTGRARAETLDRGKLDALCEDLQGEDAAKAYRAAWQLVAGAKEAVPYLRERLLRNPGVTDKQLMDWIADLDSNQAATRQQAFAELKKLDRFAEPALRKALEGTPPLEPRKRIQELLQWLNTPAEALAAARWTHVLERAGTAESRQVLEALGKEKADVSLIREVKAALGRMKAN